MLESKIENIDERLRKAGADEPLIALVQRGLAPDRDARFPSCDVFGDALQVSPPLVIDRSGLEEIADRLHTALEAL